MQQYVSEIIMPYAETCIRKHRLHADAHIILVLDVWAVHKSEEFRLFLRTHHPRIHLVFVPANCTSKLQVADVALQRPFKHSITRRFNEWAVLQIQEQIHADNVVGFTALLKMSAIKPLALQWCIDSWTVLKERRELITDAWKKCCVSLYNVMDPAKRTEAVAAVARQELEHAHVPELQEEEKQDEVESDGDDSGDDSSDSDQEELDVTQPRQFGSRRGPTTTLASSCLWISNRQLSHCDDRGFRALTDCSQARQCTKYFEQQGELIRRMKYFVQRLELFCSN